MLRSSIAAMLLLSIHDSSRSTARLVHVPVGSSVMIDGKIEPNEWSDAYRVSSKGITIYAKQHEGYLLLAVGSPSDSFGFTDLFLGPRGARLDLHASAKLGQRAESPNGSWPDWIWWNNVGWVANVARVRDFAGPSLYPENVREYEIDEKILPSSSLQLQVRFTGMKDNQVLSTLDSEVLLFDVK